MGWRGAYPVITAIKGLLPEKRRADAVLCIEYLVTASPEAFKRHGGLLDDLGGGYFTDALAWLRKRHGVENVISSTVHLDESTPHLVAYVVPRTKDGRLSCRDFLGGPSKLREMQDSFYASCGITHGLERGVRGSKAKHEEIAAFYTALAALGDTPQLRRRDYAAAALGIRTDVWKQAEEAARVNALKAAHESRRKKANFSKCLSLEKQKAQIRESEQSIAHRKIVQAAMEFDLEQRSDSLAFREKEVLAIDEKLRTLEAERDALQRRLEMRDEVSVPGEKALFRARKYDHVYTLG